MQKFTDKAKDYFERHPVSEECHITSDGRVFHTKGSAQGFAGTLDDQAIESYQRKVLLKAKAEVKKADDDKGNDGDLKPTEEQIQEKQSFLKNTEVAEIEYAEMKALVKFFEIETADVKKDTLITALTEYKTTLNNN